MFVVLKLPMNTNKYFSLNTEYQYPIILKKSVQKYKE